MNPKIRQLLAQITALEDELRAALRDQESRLFYHFKGKRIEFEGSIREAHRKLKMSVLRWIIARPQNIITVPFIYGMIFPLLFLDIGVTIYQVTCFPIYGIPRVRRADFIVMDRHLLAYLNIFERLHCAYCAYANGVIAYTFEIAARTEQYFCPIKHAHRILGAHPRQQRFLAYGNADDYHAKVDEFRAAMANESVKHTEM